jgi:hypothetical protein
VPSIAQTRRPGSCWRANARMRFAPNASVGIVRWAITPPVGATTAAVGELVGVDPDDGVDLVCEHAHGCPPLWSWWPTSASGWAGTTGLAGL